MSPHILQLKVGVPIMMLQNINQPELRNGTRLAVQKLMSNMTEATILTGPFNDEDALIPRISMIPTEFRKILKIVWFKFRDITSLLDSWNYILHVLEQANRIELFPICVCKELLPAPGNRSNKRRYREEDLATTEEERKGRNGGERKSGGEENRGREK
ncbi:ATP-dependent DNA helicase [Trichonephila clavipes]|nr:ATP-dependent DNA helicase [Trichonephila clavipes]